MSHWITAQEADAIRRAAELLEVEARALRESHTVDPEHQVWDHEDAEIEDMHAEMVDVIASLRRIAP